MLSISIRAPKLAFVVAFVSLCLIGWVAKATLAQDPAKPAPPAPPLTPDIILKVEASNPSVSPDQSPPPIQEQIPGSDVASKTPAPQPAADNIEPAVPAPSAPNPEEDPEKAAQAFVEQNQKLAESQLKHLKDEEARLRARLQKVEGGIRRWETLLDALKQSHSIAGHPISDVAPTALQKK
jgi:hypothetical protein